MRLSKKLFGMLHLLIGFVDIVYGKFFKNINLSNIFPHKINGF